MAGTFTRRRFLKFVGVSGAASAAGAFIVMATRGEQRTSRVVSGRLDGFVVPAGETWQVGDVVESTQNVLVNGTLVMRPGSTLRFVDVNESAFVGGGTSPVDSDVGLWIMDGGKLDAVGTPKLSWARATDGLLPGATSLTLDADPVGWEIGDEILVTATLPPSDPNFATANDVRALTGIKGRTVEFSGLEYAHPAVPVSPAKTLTAEVANLSRDVKIEGSPAGRAHVFIHSMSATNAQTVSNVELRHLGPTGKVGRYAWHMHLNDDRSRRSIIEGCVARDVGTWAFVSHRSHGTTFRDCVVYNVHEFAFGWDQNTASNNPNAADFTSHDVTYERCLAAHMTIGDKDRAHMFSMQLGTGNRCIDCVAVGQQAGQRGAGFAWPEKNGDDWLFEDCVAHNNVSNGLFFWVNNEHKSAQPLSQVVAYHNGRHGVEMGAYGVHYEMNEFLLFGNGLAQVLHHALAVPPGLSWRRCRLESATPEQNGFVTDEHRVWHSPVLIIDSHIKTLGQPCFRLAASGDADRLDVVNTILEGPSEVLFHGDIDPVHSIVRIQNEDNTNPNLLDGTIAAIPATASEGTFIPAWNARRVDIENFYE